MTCVPESKVKTENVLNGVHPAKQHPVAEQHELQLMQAADKFTFDGSHSFSPGSLRAWLQQCRGWLVCQ
jgi:hypothetical protein